MEYTNGERQLYCSDEYWLVEIKEHNRPNTIIGKFHTKEDALLDAAAPDMCEALKEALITLKVLQPRGSAVIREIEQVLAKAKGEDVTNRDKRGMKI